MNIQRKNKHTGSHIGISDIGVYIPKPAIELEDLIAKRTADNPRLTRHLDRAVKVTGQRAVRLNAPWEDTVTMAAEAAKKILSRKKPAEIRNIRYIASGTETGVDHSKPVSAYVEGLLQAGGLPLPQNLSSFQVQHACAAGTMALLSVGAMLGMTLGYDESGLVTASDIARYETDSTAEITQGAGAVSLLIEKNPKLLELDFSTIGYCSRNEDDFFRPIGSRIAQVKGRYSMDCYISNFKDALQDHCSRKGTSVSSLLAGTDFFVLHTPFNMMPVKAMQEVLKEHIGLVNGQTEAFLSSRGFYSGIEPIADIGNTYSASLYIALAYLLDSQYKALGRKIIGKKILLASYGSGNTMIVISAQVAEGAPEVIEGWNLEVPEESAEAAALEEYEYWVRGPYAGDEYNGQADGADVPADSFYLANIREDGYREYAYRTAVPDRIEESQTSDNLYEPAAVLG